jgi:hypothetical protein
MEMHLNDVGRFLLRLALCVAIIMLLSSIRPLRGEPQTTFRDAQGRTTGTASPEGSGTVRFRDSSGKTIGTSSTDSSGTTRYYDAQGKSLGTSTGPARAPFPERR